MEKVNSKELSNYVIGKKKYITDNDEFGSNKSSLYKFMPYSINTQMDTTGVIKFDKFIGNDNILELFLKIEFYGSTNTGDISIDVNTDNVCNRSRIFREEFSDVIDNYSFYAGTFDKMNIYDLSGTNTTDFSTVEINIFKDIIYYDAYTINSAPLMIKNSGFVVYDDYILDNNFYFSFSDFTSNLDIRYSIYATQT